MSDNARPFEQDEILPFVRALLERREDFLAAHREHGSPLYLFDETALRARAREFAQAFAATLDRPRIFYAMKSNSHPWIAQTLLEEGLGLDVSSGRELAAALAAGAERIIFSGPGKTPEELALAIEHGDRVTVLMDSFGELARLGEAAHRGEAARWGEAARRGGTTGPANRVLRAGVRLTTDERGLWRKFGIPLERLGEFHAIAAAQSNLRLTGLQFHTSWNLDPSQQTAFLARLGATLARTPALAAQLEFLDIGGGYWPPAGEWLHAPDGSPIAPTSLPVPHYRRPGHPIALFAERIAAALQAHIFPHARPRIWLEPGRWLSHDSMHLLLRVVDRKAPDLVITDAGTNAIGWERFESDYFPVINLTHPVLEERPCFILGSLCTPHDVWGYAYWGAGIEEGDVLLIPSQGAYTYGLRQDFIKPLPECVRLRPASGHAK